MKRAVILMCLLLAAGCATVDRQPAQPTPPNQGMALVHLMRTAVGYGNLWLTIFSINDTKVVALSDKEYSSVQIPPGTYHFSAGSSRNSDSPKFRMSVEAGKEYFVEYKQVPSGSRTFRDVIHSANPLAAKVLIDKFSFKEADKAYIPRTEYHALCKLPE
jgi:hypothetical protein